MHLSAELEKLFIENAIKDGRDEIAKVYTKPEEKHKLDGAAAGFDLCEKNDISEWGRILVECNDESQEIFRRQINTELNEYWELRYKALQVEWMMNVMSAVYMMFDKPPFYNSTVRGLDKAHRILSRLTNQGLINAPEPTQADS